MKEILHDIDMGTINKQDWKGTLDPPLIDGVPIDLHAFQILQVMIGVGKKVLDDLFQWVDQWIEIFSEEELASWREWQKLIQEFRIKQEDADKRNHLNATSYAELARDRSAAKVLYEIKDNNDHFIY